MSRYANKKILSIIMVICMIFTLLPMNTMGALADDAVTGEYNEWGDGVRTASGAAITKTAIEGVVYYNIWVGGNQVTSENQSNITGTGIEGTVTYDHDSHTLKLDNAIITGKHAGADLYTAVK